MTIYGYIRENNFDLGEWLDFITISTELELSNIGKLFAEMNITDYEIPDCVNTNITYLKLLDILNEMNYLDSTCRLDFDVLDSYFYILIDLFNQLVKDLVDIGA